MYVCICIYVGMHIYVCLKDTKFCLKIENFYQFFISLNILNVFLSIKIHTFKNSVNDFLKGISFTIFMLRNSSHLPKVWYIYLSILFCLLSPLLLWLAFYIVLKFQLKFILIYWISWESTCIFSNCWTVLSTLFIKLTSLIDYVTLIVIH